MNEAVKTVIYVGVALVVALVAVFTYPKQEDFEPPDLVGKPLFEEFTDPERGRRTCRSSSSPRMWDELSEFEVARDAKTGLWADPLQLELPGRCGNPDARCGHQLDRSAGPGHRFQ